MYLSLRIIIGRAKPSQAVTTGRRKDTKKYVNKWKISTDRRNYQ